MQLKKVNTVWSLQLNLTQHGKPHPDTERSDRLIFNLIASVYTYSSFPYLK